MFNLAALLSAPQAIPKFWVLLLGPLLPIGLFILGHRYRIRKGAKPQTPRWASIALLTCCTYTPAFVILAFAADMGGRTEILSHVMDSVRVQRAYDTLCNFTSDQRTPENIDWATNVLRDHVLWADPDKPFDRKTLPATAPISCNRFPYADDRASEAMYANTASLMTFFFGSFFIAALASVWGCWLLLLPKREARASEAKLG